MRKSHFFVGDKISYLNFISNLGAGTFYSLYLYNQTQDNLLDEDAPERVPNFDMEIIAKIEKKLGMKLAVGNEYFHSENNMDLKKDIDVKRNDNNRSLREDEFTPEDGDNLVEKIRFEPLSFFKGVPSHMLG